MQAQGVTQSEPETITVDQAHGLIGKGNISRGSLYNAIERREIPSRRLGKRILIPRGAFMRWLESGQVG